MWFDLTGAERPVLSFWTRWGTENGSHYSVGLHALDRPTRTVTLGNGWDNERHNGVLTRVLVPLEDFVGSEGFNFSFSLETSGGPGDGVWIDDVLLEEERRPVVGLPLSEDFSTLDRWESRGAWGLDAGDRRSWPYGVSDSPGRGVPDWSPRNDLVLVPLLDLREAVAPLLRFHVRWDVGDEQDLYVDVSARDAPASVRHWFPRDWPQQPWHRQELDLSSLVGHLAELQLRLATRTWGVGEMGITIDDLEVVEREERELFELPFVEDFEGGPDRWEWDCCWALTNESYHGRFTSISESPGGWTWCPGRHWLRPVGDFDFTDLEHPELRFWERWHLGASTWLYLDLYLEGVEGAAQTWEWHGGWDSSDGAWVERVIDLSAYAGMGRVRFEFRLDCWGEARDGVWLDDLSLGEREE